MAGQLRWRDLLPGLALAGAIAAFAAWVLVYARVGAVRGDTYRIFTVAGQARGVLKGTEVWLAGQKVGAVSRIGFRPVTADTAHRLLLELEVREEVRRLIRRDSYVQFRSGGTLIGQPVVYVSTGTVEAPPLADGDTIAALPQGDTESLVSELARLGRIFPDIARNASGIRERLTAVSGIARLDDEGLPVELDVLRRHADRLSRATRAPGTLSLALRDGGGPLGESLRSVTAHADTLAQLLSSDRTSLGRFRRDSTLAREIAGLRDELARVRALVDSPTGTVGRARLDGALRLELAALQRELDRLLEDVRRRPLRYVQF